MYRQTIEQIALLDRLGLDLVWFSEHHFVDDGYLPSFVPVAGAAAAVTKPDPDLDRHRPRSRSPIRSGSPKIWRCSISSPTGAWSSGSGSATRRTSSLRSASRDRDRVSLTEECVEILQKAWTGERFSYAGKRYQFDDVKVTPAPVQPGGPPIWMAATSPPSVERAVRFDTHLLPQGPRPVVLDPWREQMRAAGRDPDDYRVGIIRSFLVTDDPERDWPPLRAAEVYRAKVYGGFFEAAGLDSSAMFSGQGRISQRVVVGDVDKCVRDARRLHHRVRAHRRGHVGLGPRSRRPSTSRRRWSVSPPRSSRACARRWNAADPADRAVGASKCDTLAAPLSRRERLRFMQYRPTSSELLTTMADLLEGEVLADVRSDLQHKVRVAGNLLRLLEREDRLGPANDAREHELLVAMVGYEGERDQLIAEWATALRGGLPEAERPAAWAALVEITRMDLAVAKPGHDGWEHG